MDLNKHVVPSEAWYYVCVTQDVLTQLDALLQQLDQKKESTKTDEYNVVEKKVNRVLHERLPKLLQQLWQEICVGITAVLKAHTAQPSHEEKMWSELGEQCSQLSLLRSLYRFIMAALSGKAMSNGGGTIVEVRGIARLLYLRGCVLSSSEGQELKQWMIDFVLELYKTIFTQVENGNARFDELQKKITVCKETFRESSSYQSQQQQQRQHQQQQEPHQGIGSSNVNLEAEVGSCSDEEICKEHLKFLRAACIGLADDLITFLRQQTLEDLQSSPPLKEKNDGDDNIQPNLSASEPTDTVVELTGVVKDSHLTAGADRWVFFRIRPNDSPPLTLEEVSLQVRNFYDVYNAEKSSMAFAFADGYGEDYTDLFDALEYRYCFTAPEKIPTAAIETTTTTKGIETTGTTPIATTTTTTRVEGVTMSVPSEKQLPDGEVPKEAEEGVKESDKKSEEGGGCSVM
ncbi:uncharacterized protein TM35_000072820 [Trypanosoma theileri]|uniref:Uncharacterized protein n=1 Tax=Trypanosoma theileri TaxID=67003 RepID=A0A1X0P201_9TRYP|nr:uncharacterized protein TM35_000072820 [Trypanosoma theileri]ORC90858.1 hypothetical protein TM35_000072820 [Trypanosoma theileri]